MDSEYDDDSLEFEEGECVVESPLPVVLQQRREPPPPPRPRGRAPSSSREPPPPPRPRPRSSIVVPAAEAAPRRRRSRYFVLRAGNEDRLEASERRGVWFAARECGDVLNAAFDVTDNIYLVFSDSNSGSFRGFARMEGRADREGRGVLFRLDWKCGAQVPFERTRHLRNSLDGGRPVRAASEAQELGGDSGPRLLTLIVDEAAYQEKRR
jgi:hypothetical protein